MCDRILDLTTERMKLFPGRRVEVPPGAVVVVVAPEVVLPPPGVVGVDAPGRHCE